MSEQKPSHALIDPRTLDLRGLAARAKIPLPSVPVEPSSERLQLGRISGLAGAEYGELGDTVKRKVELFNSLPVAQRYGGAWAVSFEEFKANTRRNDGRSFQDYLRYLMELDPHLGAALEKELQRPQYIRESADRRAHTLITGGSRSGKSELMKLLIHHYVRHPELGGVLVVDPHNVMARQIARWREFSGEGAKRLVYLDPVEGLANGAGVPALNPLMRGAATADELATVSGQLADALAYFGGDGEGQTPQMQRLAAFGLQVLLEMEGSTLLDFMNGLTVPSRGEKGGRKAPLPRFVERGRTHPDEVVRDFFLNDWDGESYRTTRDALKRRLSTHLRAPTFRKVMTAPAPVDLEGLLNEGKVVVVPCGFDGEAGDALGRFIVAHVAAIGRRRLDSARPSLNPVHVFVDEATQLMAPPFVKILERFAKTRIWLTMGQQGAGEGGERDFLNRVRRSTGLKFLGRSGNMGELLRMVDMPRSELPQLKQGEFVVVKTGEERSAMLLQALRPSPVADNSNAMSAAEWAEVLEAQFAAYYRKPVDGAPVVSVSAPPEETDWLDE